MATAASFGRFGSFVGSVLRAVPDVTTWGRLLILQMARLGVDSLPIALFIAAFTGIVLALQASYTFTGAVPLYFVGRRWSEKTMILELGPVLTGLALAGRVGANIAAEIGTMRVTEQIDALETLAYDPVAYLVVPRVLAGVVMFPIVVAFAERDGHPGWLGTAINLLDLSTPEFVRGVRAVLPAVRRAVLVDQGDIVRAGGHGVGCFFGFRATGGRGGRWVARRREPWSWAAC